MLAYYALDVGEDKAVKINTGLSLPMTCYLLDEAHDLQEIGALNDGDKVTMRANSVLFLKK